jgi:hypothetical protein
MVFPLNAPEMCPRWVMQLMSTAQPVRRLHAAERSARSGGGERHLRLAQALSNFPVAMVKNAQLRTFYLRQNSLMTVIDFSKASRTRVAQLRIAECRKAASERTALAEREPLHRARHLTVANAWLLLAARVVQAELRSHLDAPVATDQASLRRDSPSPIKE